MPDHDNDRELTRRRVLGSLGVAGVAATFGGASTSAFFSDEETFKHNELVAGELDLKVDWQEHYSDWSSDENDDRTDDVGGDESDANLDGDPADDFEVVMADGDPANVPGGYTAFPHPAEPLVAVPDAFVDDFLRNTATEAYPDEDGDGIQDLVYSRRQLRRRHPTLSSEEIERTFRDQFADLPDDQTRPLVELTDVKPGDFGEVTFSVHLFDNPGYLWLDGRVLENAENAVTEPERKDPDEDDAVGVGTAWSGELLDEIRAVVWHDDGDNVVDETEWVYSPHAPDSESSIQLSREQAEIARGSLREVLERLVVGVPLDADPTTADRECFWKSTTRYLGFAWWLPVDHANEIQTDSVAFDLGFYTEQCRHNDGSRLDGRAASVAIDAEPATAGDTSTHSVAYPVGSALDGTTLESLTVVYPPGFDASDVGVGDVTTAGVADGGIVGASVASVTATDGGTRLAFAFDNHPGLDAGDEIRLAYDGVHNAGTTGEYPIEVVVNATTFGRGSLSLD
ncbi:hypothetical protein [Halorarius halobius]|uniref:hypothetical protein n=1 Tax=Halorarius halobius TaxID=2962671 RepID=UPI0020CF9C3D|nr:hypothetical protein [Halorarius halobius]